MLDNKFFERLEKIYSKQDLDILKDGLNTEKRPVTIRVNTLKSTKEEIEDILKNLNINYQKIDFLVDAYMLFDILEKDLWDKDFYKKGKIYLQNISSQIPVNIMDLEKGDRVLDLTAAPGSKTTQISALLDNTGEIVACEKNAIRMEKLKFNIERLGCKNIQTYKGDVRKVGSLYEENSFDKILADLPCSAEGRINLNKEKSYGFWNEANIKRNYLLQKDILKNTISMLKPGGILVYSTCTIAPEENEAIAHYIVSNFKDMKLEDINLEYKNFRPGIKSFGKNIFNKDIIKTIRCLPSVETEGFFVAKFRKDD